MVERCQDLRFALEAGQPFRVVDEGVGQHLDRHVTVQGRVVGAVDLAHPTRTDLGGDFVDAELGAGCYAHRWERPSLPQRGTGRQESTVSPQSAARKPPFQLCGAICPRRREGVTLGRRRAYRPVGTRAWSSENQLRTTWICVEEEVLVSVSPCPTTGN